MKNRIFRTAEQPMKTEEWMRAAGIRGQKLSGVPDSQRTLCRELLAGYERTSDFLRFLMAAQKKRSTQFRYVLHPPFTSAAEDVRRIAKMLMELGVISDFYYSDASDSFLAVSAEFPVRTVQNSLLIGLAESVRLHSGCEDAVYDDTGIWYQDPDAGLVRISLCLSTGLECEAETHSRQIAAFYAKVISPNTLPGRMFYVVSTNTKCLLPPCPNVISVTEIV